jgi:predicted helicase
MSQVRTETLEKQDTALNEMQRVDADILKEYLEKPGSRTVLEAPPGYGKTRVIAELIVHFYSKAENRGKPFVYFVPSKDLARQTLKELELYYPDVFDLIVISSDSGLNSEARTATGEEDETDEEDIDIGFSNQEKQAFRVTDDSSKISKFYNKPTKRGKIKGFICLYQSAHRLNEFLTTNNIEIPLAAADEAHLTAGPYDPLDPSGFRLIPLMKNLQRILFATATPRRLAPHSFLYSKERALPDMNDMGDTDKYGDKSVHRSLPEIIKSPESRLTDYTLALVEINDQHIIELAEQLGYGQGTDAAVKFIEEHPNVEAFLYALTLKPFLEDEKNQIFRAITFHSKIKRAKQFSGALWAMVKNLRSKSKKLFGRVIETVEEKAIFDPELDIPPDASKPKDAPERKNPKPEARTLTAYDAENF